MGAILATGYLLAGVFLWTGATTSLSLRVDSGWEAYAGLVLLAFAVERVVQPFSDLLGDTPDAEEQKNAALVKAAKKNTAIVTWAFASALGFIVSTALKAGVMSTIAQAPPNRWVDIAVTGLILGAGSKPVHDALSQIQSTKDAKEAASTAATQAAATPAPAGSTSPAKKAA